MEQLTELASIRPVTKYRIMDLLEQAGMDVSDWSKDFPGQHPSTNPKYCYNWSFENPGQFIVTCLWHDDLALKDGQIMHANNLRGTLRGKGASNWTTRARAFDEHIQKAYRSLVPVRVILLAGIKRDDDTADPESSKVAARLLDPVPWAVTAYDFRTGDMILTRGVSPLVESEQDDPEYSAFEGEQRRLYVLHRRREASLRRKKLVAAKIENSGKLKCEVKGCGFDFEARYGKIGEGFAHVHHTRPLAEVPTDGVKISLKDLAVVCANCHAMIHAGGECRPLDGLISA
jgi:hypothetical protein